MLLWPLFSLMLSFSIIYESTRRDVVLSFDIWCGVINAGLMDALSLVTCIVMPSYQSGMLLCNIFTGDILLKATYSDVGCALNIYQP